VFYKKIFAALPQYFVVQDMEPIDTQLLAAVEERRLFEFE
jgi:hypothetical protein